MILEITADLNKDESQFIRLKLDEFNRQFAGPTNFSEIGLALRDDTKTVVGGLIGSVVWDWLHVNVLWVSDHLRGQGYGAELLRSGERESIERGCNFAKLHTFQFQARGFYESLDYKVIAETKGFPGGYSQYLMFKAL